MKLYVNQNKQQIIGMIEKGICMLWNLSEEYIFGGIITQVEDII